MIISILAMAKLLGVKRIPCHVRARHLAWQQLRDRVAAYGPERCWDGLRAQRKRLTGQSLGILRTQFRWWEFFGGEQR